MPQLSSRSLLLSILKRRSLPAVGILGSVVVSAGLFSLLIPAEYEAKSKLILDDRQASVSELGRELSELTELGGSVDPIATQAELVVSQRVLALTQEALIAAGHADAAEQFPPRLIRKNLEVTILPATNILQLALTGNDPELTPIVLNALSAAVVAENAETIRSQAATVRQFLEDRIPEVQTRLQELEQSEQSYRQQTGVVSLPEQTESLIDSLAELENQDRLLTAQLQETRSRIDSLQQVTDVGSLEGAYAAVRAGQDEGLKRLRDQLTELEILNIESRSRLGDQHPDLLAVQDQLADVRQQYTEQLLQQLPGTASGATIAADEVSQRLISDFILSEIEFSALSERLDNLRAEQGQVQASLAALPEQQQALARLLRQQEEAATSLKLLQSKLEEARIAEAQLVSLVRVIGEAESPASKSWPKLPVILVLAIASGLMLAAGVVVLLEIFDDKVYDLDDIKALTELPVLGVTPRLATRDLSLDRAHYLLHNQSCVEAYRRVIKNIEFATGKSSNCIVVSSIQTGEGESVFAASLALVAASLSRKTLLIDANLRQPIQHQILGLTVSPGTTDVVDHSLKLVQATQPTNVNNLSILTAGEPSPNPSALIESTAMTTLLQTASAQFDWVIIETPASDEWSDAMTLGQHSDGIALVMAPKVTARTHLKTVTAELRASKVPLLGMVVNAGKVKPLNHPNQSWEMPPDPPRHTASPSSKSTSNSFVNLSPPQR